MSAGLDHTALTWVAPSKLQGRSQNTYSFLRLPSNVDALHACKYLPWMQATCIPQILHCPPKLRESCPNVLVMWEEGGQCIQTVSRPGGLSISCFFRASEVHRVLLGGSKREGEASKAAIWGSIILNTCIDSSSYSLESRNVMLLVSRGRRGPTSKLEAEPGTIMESRRRTSANQRHACLFTVQSAVGKLPQQAHKHIYKDFTARFVRNNKAITQHLRLGALYSMESYPELLDTG